MLYKNPFHGFLHTRHILMGIPIYAPLRSVLTVCHWHTAPCDSRSGYKHHLTDGYLRHLQQSDMDMCHRENLYQVDLLSPSKNKVTQKELRTVCCNVDSILGQPHTLKADRTPKP